MTAYMHYYRPMLREWLSSQQHPCNKTNCNYTSEAGTRGTGSHTLSLRLPYFPQRTSTSRHALLVTVHEDAPASFLAKASRAGFTPTTLPRPPKRFIGTCFMAG